MISVDVCRGGEMLRDLSSGEIGTHRARENQILWVDVAEPTDEDWGTLGDAFGFHPLAVEDAQKQNQRPKIDSYDDYLFLTARAWTGITGPTDDVGDATREVDIFLGPNYLVTIHDAPCDTLAEMRRRWERHAGQYPNEPAFLLYVLLDAIVDDYFPAMDAVDDEIDDLETGAYDPRVEPDLKPALRLKKHLLLMRQSIAPLRDVLNQLLRADQPLIPPATRLYLQDVYDHALRLTEQIDLHRDILAGVLDALMAQTNNRMNQVMKTLTAVSTILMSAALISGIYGMNFEFMPELRWRYGYFYALGTMFAVGGGLAAYFRRIGWF
jgi:magnesium transporter